MTAGQRRSAARRAAGPVLFPGRIRTGIGRAGRVLRLHPAGSTVPIMVLSGGTIAFLLFSTVSIHVIRPGAAGQSGSQGSGVCVNVGPLGVCLNI